MKDIILKFPSKQQLFEFLHEIRHTDIITSHEYKSSTFLGQLKETDVELAIQKFGAEQVDFPF